jgi:hypothetical protein
MKTTNHITRPAFAALAIAALIIAAVALQSTASDEWKGQKMSDQELRERLTPMQYKVTQKDGTEPAFRNEYWNNKEPGIYVDVVSGEPLFASVHKFDSGTGWPSFWRPLDEDNIVEKKLGGPSLRTAGRARGRRLRRLPSTLRTGVGSRSLSIPRPG